MCVGLFYFRESPASRKAIVNYVMSARLTTCISSAATLDVFFFLNFIMVTFARICWETKDLGKFGQ
jgi:hypothetical protein